MPDPGPALRQREALRNLPTLIPCSPYPSCYKFLGYDTVFLLPWMSSSPKTSHSGDFELNRPEITAFRNPKTSFWRYFGC